MLSIKPSFQAGQDADKEMEATSNKEMLIVNSCYLTRALIKNNIVSPSIYMILLMIEYLMMLYCVLSLIDYQSYLKLFAFTSDILDVKTKINNAQTPQEKDQAITLITTHIYVNYIFCGVYLMVVLITIWQVFKINSIEKTMESSYILKGISFFLICGKTILKIPILTSIFLVFQCLNLQVLNSGLTYSAIISSTALILLFLLCVLFALRFYNLEVPNQEIPWSFNYTGGIYFKLILKVILCSQELYRDQLNTTSLPTIVLLLVFAVTALIMVYRINTPNIFNAQIHTFTFLLESFFLSVVTIGVVSKVSGRSFSQTLAYLGIFIPVIMQICFSVDEWRKNRVLFKMKNLTQLSSNEYLIAITHLLKMINRQSQADLAQLMSFTYQHKLTCYSTDCICRFFTQYCQDPIKFQKKKIKAFRGYQDDGKKLIQIKDEEQYGLIRQIDNRKGFESDSNNGGSFPYKNNEDHSTFNLEESIQPILPVNNLIITNHIEDTLNKGPIQTNDINVGFQEYIFIENQVNNDEISGSIDNENGIMSLFAKGNILRGEAYNGFDSNVDFKIRGEFKSPSVFKTVYDSRTYFFTRLLETMFKQLEQQTTKNTSFTLLSVFFLYAYQHNIYQSILLLVTQAQSLQNSYLERIRFQVTEYFLIEQLLQEFKLQNSKEEINYALFIEGNQIQQNLDFLFEGTAVDIIEFWKLFQEERTNVQKAYLLGLEISRNIETIRKYTEKLENNQMIKDYNKYYYYAMFYQNLLNDRQCYNQMINNLKNLLMIRNIKKRNSKFIGQNTTLDINDIGFSIVSFEDDKTVGRFKYANRAICQLLNISEDDIINKSVNYMMTELVRINHDFFVRRFMDEGLPRYIGRVRTVFVKDFTNYIKPVQFFLNFHYDSKFKYCLIMHVDPISYLQLPGYVHPISTNDVISIICDRFNNVKNISQEALKTFGLSVKTIKSQEELMGRSFKMDDFVLNFDYHYQQLEDNGSNQKHKSSFMSAGTFDEIGQQTSSVANQIVKVRNFRSYDSEDAVTCTLIYEEMVYLKNHPHEFCERIYLLIPVSKLPELDNNSLQSSNVQNSGNFNIQSFQRQSMSQKLQSSQVINSYEIDSDMIEMQEQNLVSGSHSSISSSGGGTSATSISFTKGMLMNQNKNPKILQLYLYIVFGVLLSFITLSSINFAIYTVKKNIINQEITFTQLVNERNTLLITTIAILKSLHLIATDLTGQSNQSSIFSQDRQTYYTLLLTNSSDKLQSTHEQFMSMVEKEGGSLGATLNGNLYQGIQLDLVSGMYNLYQEANPYDYGIQLLTADISQINLTKLSNYPLNVQLLITNGQYKSSNSSNFSPASQTLRNLFFIYQNGMHQLNYFGLLQDQAITHQSGNNSSQSRLYINLMSFISMGLITLIGIFTFPILGKIEDRKISVLKFFNLLTNEQIQDLINKGKEFQEEFLTLTRKNNKDQKLDQNEIVRRDEKYQSSSYNSLELYHSKQHAYKGKEQDSKKIVAIEDTEQVQPNYNQHDWFSFQRNYLHDVDGPSLLEKPEKLDQEPDEEAKDFQSPKTTDKLRLQFEHNNFDSPRDNTFELKRGVLDKAFEIKPPLAKTEKRLSPQKKVESTDQFTSMKQIMNIFKKIAKNNKKQNDISTSKRQKQRAIENLDAAFDQKNKKKNNGKSVFLQKVEKMSSQKTHNFGIIKHQYTVKIKDNAKKKAQNKLNLANEHRDERESENDGDQIDQDFEKENKVQKYKEVDKESIATNRTEYISDQLRKIALKEKVKLVFYVLIVLLFLNSNLFVCYYLGHKTFSEDQTAIQNLEYFYHRKNYLANLLLYSQESFIENQTISLNATSDADVYFQNLCQQNEQKYNELRQSMPIFFKGSVTPLNQIESSQLCEVTLAGDQTRITDCTQAYNSILERGLTSFLYMIYNHESQYSVLFEQNQRTQAFLNSHIRDQTIRDIFDLLNEFVYDTFDYINASVTQSAIVYFDGIAQIYMVIYVVYMVLAVILCFFFGFYVFKKLKLQIVTSANVLSIMPMEDLQHKDRVKIESFLNS